MPSAGFDTCQPLQVGGYSTNAAGFYLLVLAPAETTEGRAPTSGLGNVASSCNTRYLWRPSSSAWCRSTCRMMSRIST